MSKIGFIGLGIMGLPMAKNLIGKGYTLVVYNRSKHSVNELVSLGAEEAQSPEDVASKVEVIITMLPDSSDVKKVVLEEKGAIYGLEKSDMLIDMSSISPSVTKEIASVLDEKGIRMLDAPVSGGEPGAINATLSIMVGGDAEDFAQFQDILSVLGSSVKRVGEIGSGNVVKLVNQSIVALNIAAISEALMLGSMSGVKPERIFEAIQGGLAGSHVLDAKFPKMIENDFKPGFTLNLHKKDLDNVLKEAETQGTMMPLTSMVTEYIRDLINYGEGQSDHSALLKYFENLSDHSLKWQSNE